MDTSEIYVKMCEKAELKHKPQEGDLYYDKRYELFYWNCKIGKLQKRWQYLQVCVEEDIWLPRQDQLQEMISKDDEAYVILEFFNNWFDDFNPDEWNFKWSMEQLWLAFIMYERHQKLWDDEKEEWINNDN